MDKSSFIRLLEEYKGKATKELYNECKVQAAMLISGEFKQAIAELENASVTVNAGFKAVSQEIIRITSSNAFGNGYGSFCYNPPSTHILENVIGTIAAKIHGTVAFRRKEDEIKSKFDAAIRAAKATRSAAKLKELADALGIETPSIEVATSVSTTVDTEFVKEKIKSVLLLS
jgi:hypothetical protein